ncbi:MAG: hypothetical protein WBE38_09605 [Terracidiphilus sp.]|jgi:hypothetical protein
MISSQKGTAPIRSGVSSSVSGPHADWFAREGFDPRRPQSGGPSEVSALNGADEPLVASAKKPPRILLVDAVLALHELHRELLRSIPAIVETLASCTDMYAHEEHAYALVILVLHPHSRKTAEAADFVRHRWRAARILLLESESAEIDDWLYDERVDPHLHPMTLREAAIRLMTQEEYRVSA